LHAFFARQQKRPAETLGMLPQATRIRSAGCSHGTAELTNEMSGVFPSDCFALPLAVGLPQELSADPRHCFDSASIGEGGGLVLWATAPAAADSCRVRREHGLLGLQQLGEIN